MARFGSLVRSQREADRSGQQEVDRNPRQRTSNPNDDGGISLGSLMRGFSDNTETPAQSREELDIRAQRNAGFLQQPEIQAAMLQFAINIMQPLGSGAGWGDFAGAFGNAVGGGVQAAGNYQLVQQEEEDRLLEQDLAERGMAVREGQLTLQEEESLLAQEDKKLNRGLAEREMKVREGGLAIEERKLGQTKKSMIVSASHPFNEQFGLGLEGDDRVRGDALMQDGQVIGFEIDAPFGDNDKDGGVAEDIIQLSKEAEKARLEGNTKLANQLDAALDAKSKTGGGSLTTIDVGDKSIPDKLVEFAVESTKEADTDFMISNELQSLKNMTAAATTGALTPITKPIAAVLRHIGIETTEGEQVPLMETLQSGYDQIALRFRNPESGFGLPGATSNADLDFLKEISGGLQNTPEGNMGLLTVAIAKSRRNALLKAARAEFILREGTVTGWNEYRNELVNQNELFTSEEEVFLDSLSNPEREPGAMPSIVPTTPLPPSSELPPNGIAPSQEENLWTLPPDEAPEFQNLTPEENQKVKESWEKVKENWSTLPLEKRKMLNPNPTIRQ